VKARRLAARSLPFALGLDSRGTAGDNEGRGSHERPLVGELPLSRKKPVPRKKRRTREHVIADLSANHVERHALLCGYSVERHVHEEQQ
jgi:hypothetical protein